VIFAVNEFKLLELVKVGGLEPAVRCRFWDAEDVVNRDAEAADGASVGRKDLCDKSRGGIPEPGVGG
jgi:hypothetical protein